MILNSQPKQLTLKDDGQILWQADASNPLPGQPVATLRKGAAQLKPEIDLIDSDLLQGQDKAALVDFIKGWMDQHINNVLGTLMGLVKEEGIEGQARGIAFQLHEALGILPRQDLESLIAGLDPEARKVLRQRHVRLGPVLVFVPELNKPAAVKLRALLWWLWHDRTLPAPVPKDGVVSMVIADETTIDPVYQRAIGYPVYGGRAIRVDMLDRLISAIYDGAKDGTFKATHAMAEWMGCSIPDLYKIIESMGHKKTFDPAEQLVAEAVVETPKTEDSAAPESPPAASEETPAVEAVAPAPVVLAVKPDLATFRLKRGKANEAARPPRAPRPQQPAAPHKKQRPAFKKDDKFKGRSKPKGGKPEREERKPTSFEAKPTHVEDSPFAVLQQLKAGMKDK
jgi:ATP-dependent RNA helicase SUPV3L1/SUV3